MNFQHLPKIERYQTYLDIAFKNAKKKYIEIERIKEATKILCNQLKKIYEKFPRLEELPEFYNYLARITIRYEETRHALGAIKWADKQCMEIGKKYALEMKRAGSKQELLKKKKEFYGRISSIIKQVKEKFTIIDESRKIMKTWPDIKTGMRTIAIAGYPNVGKSSLLKALTGANPEIKEYAFTTKSLNLGYLEIEPRTYQIIDTPGTFERDISEMNKIEKQAYLVIEYLAEKIIYVFDPTETCGYETEKQILLMERLKNLFKKEFIPVCNKSDLQEGMPEEYEEMKKIQDILFISAKTNKDIDELKKRIAANYRKI